MASRLAIEVRGAKKSYGSLQVLHDLNMDVEYGSVYGLLGSSGCGKTTLLRCILGRLHLQEGHVTTLGRPPGMRGHTIPGRDVGYMPQELALFGDFTMIETMYYFGTLYGMGVKKIRERGKFLLELLELPSISKRIRKLSGGQQRRVSFAVAMLQEPPLLVLDEPTVGVDPLLRAKIWHHLLELVAVTHTTIIITTHYIEEARQAHVVGLMRDGSILAQAPPNDLIQTYRMRTLEEVFLHLCRRQEFMSDDGDDGDDDIRAERRLTLSIDSASVKYGTTYESHHSHISTGGINDAPGEDTPLVSTAPNRRKDNLYDRYRQMAMSFCDCGPCYCNPRTFVPKPINIAALFWKNITRIYRNPGILLFQFLLPTLQIAIFCLSIGRNLEGVDIAIVDKDVGLSNNATVCDIQNFGSLFISKLDTKLLTLNYFDTVTKGIDEVKHGRAWTAIFIPATFSQDLKKRVVDLMQPSHAVPQPVTTGSTIELYEDITNLQLTYALQNAITLAIEHSIETMANNCNISKSMLSSPLKIHQPPVYGRTDLSFTDFVAPGILISITFGMSIGLTAISLVVERKEGLLDRSWVAGVNVTEIIIAQVLSQILILLVQIILLVIVIAFVFKVYMVHKWGFILVGTLCMLQGLTGMSYGLLISSLCREETAAIQVMAGSYYPILLISGILWPLQGMPKALRYISYGLPTTYAAEAMRSIMERGWSIDEVAVWRGYLITVAWFVIFLTLATIGLRLRK